MVGREDFVRSLEVKIHTLAEQNNHEIAALVGDILDRICTPDSH